jgi:hypothetical protein
VFSHEYLTIQTVHGLHHITATKRDLFPEVKSVRSLPGPSPLAITNAASVRSQKQPLFSDGLGTSDSGRFWSE